MQSFGNLAASGIAGVLWAASSPTVAFGYILDQALKQGRSWKDHGCEQPISVNLYALTLLSGLVLAVERPAMQALLFQLVGRVDLPSAVAANSTIMAVSRLVGPALGGAMVAVTGIASCFYANAVSYAAVFVALASISRSQLVARPISTAANRNLRAAVSYVQHRPDVRRPLVVMAVVGLVALNFQTTFPSMVRFGFDRGAGAVGAAMSVSAIGSILGGIYAAGITPNPGRTLALVLVGFSVMLLLFSAAPNYPTFVLLGIPLGFASACFQSINTVAVQQAIEPSMQGRVMALHQIAWYGSTPIGALAMGWVIQTTSPRVPFVLGGLAALACAIALARAAGRHATGPFRAPQARTRWHVSSAATSTYDGVRSSAGLDLQNLEADLHDRVLTVRIPVAEQAKPRKVEVGQGRHSIAHQRGRR